MTEVPPFFMVKNSTLLHDNCEISLSKLKIIGSFIALHASEWNQNPAYIDVVKKLLTILK